MKILVIRFRQMGDAILATPFLSTLRANFPDAQIDFVLNERIAPLFEGHPAISHIITFSDEERHSVLTYIRKVWRTVHLTRYDAIIDMRSTVNTMLFALFSLRSRLRVGIRKPYTWGVFNHRFEGCEDDESMIDHNLKLAHPLLMEGAKEDRNLSLAITEKEQHDFRQYMERQGIDFSRPVMLVGVTAKLAHKTWAEDRMTEVLRRLIEQYPQLQLVFNYAPGQEEQNAREIYELLGCPPSVFINVQARSGRELAAMCASISFYFGNEGGARHIVHAMGKPSIVVCSPHANPKVWIPQDDVTALAISNNNATTDNVWQQLKSFVSSLSH